ncbi:MAG: hypothetical protein Q9170_004942 [Blastenia crenularia]
MKVLKASSAENLLLKQVPQCESDIQNSIQDCGTSNSKPENIPTENPASPLGCDSATIQRFLSVVKKELKDNIKTMGAARRNSGLLEEFMSQHVPTRYSNSRPEHDATVKRSDNQLVAAKAALEILQRLERSLFCQNQDDFNENSIKGWFTTILRSAESLNWNIPRGQRIQAMSPASINESWPKPPLPTTVLMAIHVPGGRPIQRVAKLDTGSSQNLISRELISCIGFPTESYEGNALQGIGPSFTPSDQTTLEWHVSGKQAVHRTKFAVLEDLRGGNLYFDILLSEHEIRNVGFYIWNHTLK